jgi:heme O synthase-like polyprenyltransferase
MIIPGAALGAAGGFLFRDRSPAFGIVCGILAILLGIFAEWWTSPFIADGSFGYFLTHLQELKPVNFIMIALGGLCGFWFGQGRNQETVRS